MLCTHSMQKVSTPIYQLPVWTTVKWFQLFSDRSQFLTNQIHLVILTICAYNISRAHISFNKTNPGTETTENCMDGMYNKKQPEACDRDI